MKTTKNMTCSGCNTKTARRDCTVFGNLVLCRTCEWEMLADEEREYDEREYAEVLQTVPQDERRR